MNKTIKTKLKPTKPLLWHYAIVKNKGSYFIAEIVGDDSWVLYNDTIEDTPEGVIQNLVDKILDCTRHPILEVKKNKLCKLCKLKNK